jgi:hypothetical protein
MYVLINGGDRVGNASSNLTEKKQRQNRSAKSMHCITCEMNYTFSYFLNYKMAHFRDRK